MSIELTEILAAMINFGIFFVILRVFFFEKISAVMDERNQAIRENIDHAQADRREAELLVQEARESARQNKVAGAEVISKYKEKAEEVYEDIVSDARAEAKLIVQRGTKNAERELQHSRREMRHNVVELATMLSKKAIGEDARVDTHERLVDEIIDKVGDA